MSFSNWSSDQTRCSRSNSPQSPRGRASRRDGRILISVKPLVVGTPKLKLIVRVEQEKGGTLVQVLAPIRIIQVLVVILSHLPEFSRSQARGP